MYDPQTVAHEIRYPWRKWGRKGQGDWARNYRESFITIWHVDPEDSRGKICRRGDDTCGWFDLSYTEQERNEAICLARQEYSTVFEKQCRDKEGVSYASVCFVPTAYDAIYWIWRTIKYRSRKRGWKFGDAKSALSSTELQEIYSLASNPVDNLRVMFSEVRDEETFIRLFLCVWRAYRRHHRPWYKHPRWHIHHWKLQIHPWQNLKRRYWDKCCRCGKRGFPVGNAACGDWGGKRMWHSTCDEVHPHVR